MMGHDEGFHLRSAVGRGADPVQGLPILAGCDQLRSMAVLPFSAEPAHGRGIAGRAGHRSHVRDGAVLSGSVRSGARQTHSLDCARTRDK